MTTAHDDDGTITGKHRRTLDAIFHHPAVHNLEWRDAAGLIGHIGEAHEGTNNDFVFTVGGERLHMRKPHSKDLSRSEVTELRHFLQKAGFAPGHATTPEPPSPPAGSLLIVADHHGAKIFHVSAGDTAEHTIHPYDPHHFLHHLKHKNQDRERGQRAPEEPAYYEQIAQAAAQASKIVVIGHGSGQSNAAEHLIAYLRDHHPQTFQRVVAEVNTDISAVTDPQLLQLARQIISKKEVLF